MKRIAKESSFNIPVYTNERKLIWFNANYNLNSGNDSNFLKCEGTSKRNS